MGLLKLGALVRYMPVAIVIGFTNGIAVLIALSQLRDLFGLPIDKMPADFFAQIGSCWPHMRQRQPVCAGHRAGQPSAGCSCGRACSPARLPPSGLIEGRTVRAVCARARPGGRAGDDDAAGVVRSTLPVETIGTRFGGIPRTLPDLALPPFSWETAKQLLIPTVTIALLGAIESLLCARVADNLTRRCRATTPTRS